jgi:NAD(P)-dependent dehydrogenase (short-subunit alcohol dehydrogenase family)
MELTSRNVVVTGGAGALGGAVVEALRARGATLHAPAIDDVDFGDEAAVGAYYAGLPAVWASIHLIGGFVMKPILDTTLGDLDHMLALNTRTCFLACREAVRAMRRGGEGAGGRIVNVIARPVLAPTGGLVAYAASKAAVASITQSLAAELRDEDIWVNAVAPSLIDTPANRASMPDADHASWPRAADLARVICDLASPENRLISGALVPLYGHA